MKSFTGFTLAETLITILIVGILASLTLAVVMKQQPDKLETVHRKSYYILEQTIAQISNDDLMYPKRTDGSLPGFKNTAKIKLNGKTFEGNTKFCELFANALTLRSNTSISCLSNTKTLTAADNVDWYLPVTDFSDGYAAIKFDVNGNNEPNCEYNATSCLNPDTFTYYITSNGQISEHTPTIQKRHTVSALTYLVAAQSVQLLNIAVWKTEHIPLHQFRKRAGGRIGLIIKKA